MRSTDPSNFTLNLIPCNTTCSYLECRRNLIQLGFLNHRSQCADIYLGNCDVADTFLGILSLGIDGQHLGRIVKDLIRHIRCTIIVFKYVYLNIVCPEVEFLH